MHSLCTLPNNINVANKWRVKYTLANKIAMKLILFRKDTIIATSYKKRLKWRDIFILIKP